MAAWVVPLISGIASLGSALLNRRKTKPPANPDYEWISKYGPAMWNKLSSEAYNMIDRPYGIPEDIRNRMYTTARNTAEAGYGAAQQGINRTAVLSGLSPAGGSATRQQYYAGQQMAEGLNQAYGNVDIADYQAREEQKNRGYNLLFSLSNKSPIYSQIASQNYWNALNASQESAANWAQLLGGTAGNLTQSLMDSYSHPDSGRTSYENPNNYYRNNPYDNSNPYMDITDPYHSGYAGM